jgi:hypothetical protein
VLAHIYFREAAVSTLHCIVVNVQNLAIALTTCCVLCCYYKPLLLLLLVLLVQVADDAVAVQELQAAVLDANQSAQDRMNKAQEESDGLVKVQQRTISNPSMLPSLLYFF